MAQREIELILLRQLASSLAMPIFVVDPRGDPIYFNEAAERLFGRSFDEADEMSFEERTRVFSFRNEDGELLERQELPLVRAMTGRHPIHCRVTMRSYDGSDHRIEVTAFPLEAAGARLLGGVAIFWEIADA